MVYVFMGEIATVGRLADAYYLDLKRSCSGLGWLADLKFQVVVTPTGQEGI